MKRKLTALIHEFDDEWDEALPATLLAMRTSVHRTTGYTPFFLEHGREARLPIDLISRNPNNGFTQLDWYVMNMKDKFHKAYKVVAEQQNSYILRQQELYREREKRIKVDDLVWVHTDKPNPELNRKFQSFWSGPYRVVEQVTNVIYKEESYGRWTREPLRITVAVNRLKKCYLSDPETNEGVPVALQSQDLTPYFEDSTEIVGRIPANQLAPHLFEDVDDLPFTIPEEHPEDPPEAQSDLRHQFQFSLLDGENRSKNLDQHLPFCLETQNRRRKLLPQKNCRRPSVVVPKVVKLSKKHALNA